MTGKAVIKYLLMLLFAATTAIAYGQPVEGNPFFLAAPASTEFGQGYATRLEYRVNEAGQAGDCRILISSGDTEVDIASYKLFTNVRLQLASELVDTRIAPTVYWRRTNEGALQRCCFLITADDYPPIARRQEHQGRVKTSSTIGLDGRLKDCRIVESSGHVELDEAVCLLITLRARFTPAKNEQGQPIESGFEYNARWALPDAAPPPSE